MNTTETAAVDINIDVNEDGQIVWKTGEMRGPSCIHVFSPVVVPRALSLAIAKAVVAAQEGEKR
ncbi:hypothetical protein [Sorangium sp. So ce388]|uniref:hypothetical protein n=1 Tax=Sorangium sp. So ce388 TaxID=3133309 RepID=UPI003F5B7BED